MHKCRGKAETLQAQVETEQARADRMTRELEQERRLRKRAEERVSWAMMQYEAQRGFGKHSLSDFLEQ